MKENTNMQSNSKKFYIDILHSPTPGGEAEFPKFCHAYNDFFPKSIFWKGGNVNCTVEKPNKHYLYSTIKVNINSDVTLIACTLHMMQHFTLGVFFPKPVALV